MAIPLLSTAAKFIDGASGLLSTVGRQFLATTVHFEKANVTAGNLAAFADMTGKVIEDSGVSAGSGFLVSGGPLGTPSSGTLTNTTGLPISTGVSGLGAGVATFLATPSSANLATAVTGETGTGALVFANSPALTTPALGTPASGTLTSCTGLPVSTGVSGLGAGVATFLGTPSSANLASAVTGETGSGALVFATSPALTTPAIGTPTSGVLTSCTGLPISTGVSGLGTNVATFLATPSSANLAAALTDEVGTGSALFGDQAVSTGSGVTFGSVGTALVSAFGAYLVPLAFASLPGSPAAGYVVTISDSNTNTWGATIGGSGANVVLAFYNGSNWTVAGK